MDRALVSTDERAARAKALADPTRRRLLRLILDSPAQRALVSRLAEAVGFRQPTVSHHMRVLLAVGLVTRQPSGRTAWYAIAPDAMEEVAAALGWSPARVPVSGTRDRVVEDLRLRFAASPAAHVEEVVDDSIRRLAGLDDERDALPLAARFAADRLDAELGVIDERPTVLFVCVRNAGRSQIAAAILRQLAGDRVRVRTAGSDPAGRIGATVTAALAEIGVPLLEDFPKPLTDEMVRAADVVVTMGCGDACPVYPGITYLDWPLEDPATLPLDGVREVRDDIDSRVRELLTQLCVNAR